jgi:dienelactone hydrolase
MRILKRVLLILLAVLLLAVAGFVIWGYTPPKPMPEAFAALQSDAQVQVTTSPWLTFTPAGTQPTTGFIFYPGGRVDPRSYAPQARAIAEQGYLVTIVPMPLNLAVLGTNRADAVIKAHPEIEHWVIGGHSLGGAMAANYVYTHPDAVQGMALWAAYPANNNSLADRQIPITSIYGTRDGQAARFTEDATRALLPASARYVPIEGGNHAQMGWYGPQAGDGEATISREAQQQQTVAATVELLATMGK